MGGASQFHRVRKLKWQSWACGRNWSLLWGASTGTHVTAIFTDLELLSEDSQVQKECLLCNHPLCAVSGRKDLSS